jgi:hypothetical protein
MGTPTLQRPMKTGGVRSYVAAVNAASPSDLPVYAAEIDADIDLVVNAWNNPASAFPPTGPATGDLDGSSYPAPVIAAGKVTTAKLADGAVTFVKRGEVAQARVERSAGAGAQSIPSATSTRVVFDSILTNIGGIYSAAQPDRFTVPTAGFYLIGGTIQWAAGGVGERDVAIALDVNSPLDTWIGTVSTPPASFTMAQTVTTARQLTASMIVSLVAWQDSGAALNIFAGSALFWIVRVG